MREATVANLNDKDFEFVLVCACRYAIGRRSVAPAMIAEIVSTHADSLTEETRKQIARAIIDATDLGDPCDEQVWRALLQQLEMAGRAS